MNDERDDVVSDLDSQREFMLDEYDSVSSPRKGKGYREVKDEKGGRSCVWLFAFFVLVLVTASVALGIMLTRDHRGSSGEDAHGSKGPNAPGATPAPPKKPRAIKEYYYHIANTYPHSVDAFTEGILWDNGTIIESDGLIGLSKLRRVNLKTGEDVRVAVLDGSVFAEGCTLYNGQIVQLTYTSQIGYVYDSRSLELLSNFTYDGEGWGLTISPDQKLLYMTNGSAHIQRFDPSTFKPIMDPLRITAAGADVHNLNELEFVEGELWANVFLEDTVVRIDPESGEVVGRIHLEGLLQKTHQGDNVADVLNGIAYDKDTKRIFMTGKYWAKIYEVEIIQRV